MASKRILLIAATTGYQTRAFQAAGERLGYEIQLATDCCHVLEDPWGDHAIPLRFEHPAAAASVLHKKAGPVDGIVAVGDRPAYVAAVAAAKLGLKYHSPDAVLACRDKFLARQRFHAAGMLVPGYRRVALAGKAQAGAAASETGYPCVLKPLGLSASRGVIRADNSREFVAAFERIRAILASPEIVRRHEDQDRFLQVEDYIDGREFAVEGLVSDGRLTPVAVFDKPDPMEGPYFEETIYVTPSRAGEAVVDAILAATRQAVQALGLTDGPIHAEMRVNDRGVWMLEVSARPIGGLCAQALRFESGCTLEDLVLRHAAGDDVGSLRFDRPSRGVMMIPVPRAGIYTGVSGVDDARRVPAIEDVIITAKEGQKLVPLPEGASYTGFIFAAGDNPAAVEQALRGAHGCLRFSILEALPVMRPAIPV